MRDHRSTVVFVALLALVVGACSGSGDVTALPDPDETTTSSPSSSSSSSTTSTSTTTSAPTTEPIPTPDDGEVFDQYIADRVEAFYDLVDRAVLNPTPSPEDDYPDFTDLAANEQLDVIYESVKTFAADGERVQEPPEPAVGTTTDEEFRISPVLTNDGNVLTVESCQVDDEDVVDTETGEVLITGVLTILTTVTLEWVDESWKVTSTEVTDKLRGVGGCYFAAESAYPY